MTCSANTEPSKHRIGGRRLGRGLSDPPELHAPPRQNPMRFYFCFQPLFGIPG